MWLEIRIGCLSLIQIEGDSYWLFIFDLYGLHYALVACTYVYLHFDETNKEWMWLINLSKVY
jgi:hypothetical protein